MSQVTFKGKPIALWGKFPDIGTLIEDFRLVTNDLKEVSLADFTAKNIVMNIFPSLDTGVCAQSVRTFNEKAAQLKDTIVLCVSKDLPFAQSRFCTAENIKNVQILSAYRYRSFQQDFGVGISDEPLKELLARAVIVLDKKREVVYSELVPEITQEPDYAKCLAAIPN